MRKLTLKVDELEVETFATTGAPRADGTVFGHATEYPGCSTEHLYNCTDPDTNALACVETGGTCGGVSCATTCFVQVCGCGTDAVHGGTCNWTCATCDGQDGYSCSPGCDTYTGCATWGTDGCQD